MTELARLLKHRRGSRSLRSLVKQSGRVSLQSLSNYESSRVIPREKKLCDIAECYDIPLHEVQAAWRRDIDRWDLVPVSEEAWLRALHDIVEPGDHLVVVTQNSLIGEKSYLARELLALLDKGMLCTYVAFLPETRLPARPGRLWRSNHSDSAIEIQRKANAIGKPELLSGIRYLRIGQPDQNDYWFLGGSAASSYLRVATDSDGSESLAWNSIVGPDYKPWWVPVSDNYQSLLDEWITRDCGLRLPGFGIDRDRAHAAAHRMLKELTLDEMISLATHDTR